MSETARVGMLAHSTSPSPGFLLCCGLKNGVASCWLCCPSLSRRVGLMACVPWVVLLRVLRVLMHLLLPCLVSSQPLPLFHCSLTSCSLPFAVLVPVPTSSSFTLIPLSLSLFFSLHYLTSSFSFTQSKEGTNIPHE